jgi:carboxyl-terminal processing protease
MSAAMKKVLLAGLIVLDFGFCVSILMSTPSFPESSSPDKDELARNATLFSRALELVRQDYVEAARVGYHNLVYAALHGMVEKLDPHSQFVEPVDFREELTENRGEMSGFGLVLTPVNGVTTVVSLIEGTPAAKAGFAPGDQILSINGTSTEHKSFDDVGRLLRGEPGQTVSFRLFRPQANQTVNINLERQFIKVPSVKDSKILDPAATGLVRIGYLRITEFVSPTAQELDIELNRLEQQGMQALILDLRFNPGGLVRSAVDTCGLFVPPKTMVVYTEGRDPAQNQQYYTEVVVDRSRSTYPVALLVNSETASAAEIVAGALKDLKRAILVGETTFGKGVVQSEVPLPDGSAIRLTTARYFTPNRQIIQGRGISPDIRSCLNPDEEHALIMRRRLGSLTPSEQNTLAQTTDEQLERAAGALRALMVHRAERR